MFFTLLLGHLVLAYARRDLVDATPGASVPIAVFVPPTPEGNWENHVQEPTLLAIQYINNHSTLLPNTTLVPRWIFYDDTVPTSAAFAYSKYLLEYQAEEAAMSIGPLFNRHSAAEDIAYFTTQQGINMIDIGSSVMRLADREAFPYLLRLWSSGETEIRALLRFLNYNNWQQISIVVIGDQGIELEGLLQELAPGAGIEVIFSMQLPLVLDDYSFYLEQLEAHDSRVIVALAESGYPVANLMHAVVKHGLIHSGQIYIGTSIVWGSSAYLSPEVWEHTDQVLFFGPDIWKGDRTHRGAFIQDMVTLMEETGAVPNSTIASSAGLVPQKVHDAILIAAYSLHEMIELKRFCNSSAGAASSDSCTLLDAEDDDTVSLQRFLTSQSLTASDGLRGPDIVFDQGEAVYSMGSVQTYLIPEPPFLTAELNGLFVPDVQSENWTWADAAWVEVNGFNWRAYGGQVPVDRVSYVQQNEGVSDAVFGTTVSFAGLVCVISVGFMIFSIVHRGSRVMRMSSFRINCVSAIGAIMFVSSAFTGQTMTPLGCTLQLWLLVLGFAFLFGPMFSKTWRVHRIFASATTLTKVKLTDTDTLRPFFVLLALDVIILVTWMLVAPQVIHNELQTPVSTTDPNLRIIYSRQTCSSDQSAIFASIILVVQGAVLVVGSILSYRSRTVKVKELNDSMYIGLIIYTTTLLAMFAVPLALTVQLDSVDATYIFVSVPVVVVALIAMLLLFVPKVLGILIPRFAPPASVTSSKVRSSKRANNSLSHRGPSTKRTLI